MNRIRLCGLGAFAIATIGGAAFLIGRVSADGAPTTQTLAYSGALEESGAPVTGTRDITLRFFLNEAAVDSDCTSATTGVAVAEGRFRIAVSAECTSFLRAHADTLLEVEVVDPATGTPRRLPRARIGAVPFALEADHALRCDTAQAGGSVDTRLTAVEPVAAQIVASGNQTIPSGVATVVDFTDQAFVIGAAGRAPTVDLTTNTITITTPGIYRIAGYFFGNWVTANDALAGLALRVNGTEVLWSYQSVSATSGTYVTSHPSEMLSLQAGDKIDAIIFHNYGSNRISTPNAGGRTRLAIELIR